MGFSDDLGPYFGKKGQATVCAQPQSSICFAAKIIHINGLSLARIRHLR